MKCLMLAAAAAVSMIAPQAMAQGGYSASPLNGNQSYGDNLGLDFNVVSGPVWITSLGAFDDDNDGITSNVRVGIWDITNASWVVPLTSFLGQTAASGNAYAFLSITPTLLGPGNYSVIAIGHNGANLNFNTNISGQNNASPINFNDLGGRLVDVGSRYGGGANPNAATIFAPKSAFAGGTFVAVVPEPGTWAMMIGGFGLVGFSMRRRRKVDLALA